MLRARERFLLDVNASKDEKSHFQDKEIHQRLREKINANEPASMNIDHDHIGNLSSEWPNESCYSEDTKNSISDIIDSFQDSLNLDSLEVNPELKSSMNLLVDK